MIPDQYKLSLNVTKKVTLEVEPLGGFALTD
jgi:hypothetical protein